METSQASSKLSPAWVATMACISLGLIGCSSPTGSQQRDLQPAQWTEARPADGSQPAGRAEGSLALAGDQIVAIGGRGLPETSIFDLKSCSWTNGPAAPFQIHHFQAVARDSKVYVLGAFTEDFPSEKPIENVMIYDVTNGRWQVGPQIPPERRRGAAAAVIAGEWIYVIGGIRNGHQNGHVAWADRFNITTGEWEKLADAPRVRDHLAAALVGDQIVVGGGRLSMAPTDSFTQTVEAVDIFDTASGTWSTLETVLPTPRAGLAATTRGDSAIFLGGESGSQSAAHSEVEGFTVQGTSKRFADMPIGRHGFSAATRREGNEDAVYVAGGVPTRGGGKPVLTLHRLGIEPGPCDAND